MSEAFEFGSDEHRYTFSYGKKSALKSRIVNAKNRDCTVCCTVLCELIPEIYETPTTSNAPAGIDRTWSQNEQVS